MVLPALTDLVAECRYVIDNWFFGGQAVYQAAPRETHRAGVLTDAALRRRAPRRWGAGGRGRSYERRVKGRQFNIGGTYQKRGIPTSVVDTDSRYCEPLSSSCYQSFRIPKSESLLLRGSDLFSLG